jgi:hypothetical protein
VLIAMVVVFVNSFLHNFAVVSEFLKVLDVEPTIFVLLDLFGILDVPGCGTEISRSSIVLVRCLGT